MRLSDEVQLSEPQSAHEVMERVRAVRRKFEAIEADHHDRLKRARREDEGREQARKLELENQQLALGAEMAAEKAAAVERQRALELEEIEAYKKLLAFCKAIVRGMVDAGCLQDVDRDFGLPVVPMRTIAEDVEKWSSIEWSCIAGPCRENPLTALRASFVYLATRFSRRSLPQIGRFLGGRDHTTIIHARNVARHVAAHFECEKAPDYETARDIMLANYEHPTWDEARRFYNKRRGEPRAALVRKIRWSSQSIRALVYWYREGKTIAEICDKLNGTFYGNEWPVSIGRVSVGAVTSKLRNVRARGDMEIRRKDGDVRS